MVIYLLLFYQATSEGERIVEIASIESEEIFTDCFRTFLAFLLSRFSVCKMQIERHASSELEIINLTFVSVNMIHEKKWQRDFLLP
jgi:hypothetical protein